MAAIRAIRFTKKISNNSLQPTAYGVGWIQGVSLLFIPAHFSPWISKRHLPSQAFIRWVFGVRSGFACMGCPSFKHFWALLANSSDGNRRTSVNDDFDVRHLSSASLAFARRAHFWPLALVQQAQAAIVFVVRGLCGHFRFCALGLTRRSSRPAYCGRLILFVSTTETHLYFAHVY